MKFNGVFILLCIVILFFMSISPSFGLILHKSGPHSAQFGDKVKYVYSLTNNESRDLYNINIHDNKLGILPVGNLAAYSSVSVSFTHVINESDMPGPLNNNATAIGVDGSNNIVYSNVSEWQINLGYEVLLRVIKTPSDAPSVKGFPIGSNITYTIIAANRNGFTIHSLSVEDELYHPTAIHKNVPLNRTTLAPGENASGTVVYTVVQEDILGGPENTLTPFEPKITNYARGVCYPSWLSNSSLSPMSSGCVPYLL